MTDAKPGRVKVVIGWVLVATYDGRDYITDMGRGLLRWSPRQRDAVRMTRKRARARLAMARQYVSGTRMVRLWRWVAVEQAPGADLLNAARRVLDEWGKPESVACGPGLCAAVDNLAAKVAVAT